MIAYKRSFLDNLLIAKTCRKWFASGLISVSQMAKVQKDYPANYYDPNLFVRIGLFLFMWLMIAAAFGLYALITLPAISSGDSDTFRVYGIFTGLIFGSLSFFMLEHFIRTRAWFGNGMDDALLYSGLCSVYSVIIIFIGDNLNSPNDLLIICSLFLPFLILSATRYLDRLVTLAAVKCIYSICFLLVMKVGPLAKFIMPFVFMVLSAGLFLSVQRFLKKEGLVHYQGCLRVVKATCLIVFYISGNYFVIRESSIEFFGLNLSEGQDIPMAFLFYGFTAIVPLGYLFYGLKKKDKLMVWVALVLIALAVLTFKYYFSLGHPEVTLTTAGLVMILLAYWSIRYLAEDRYGITFKDDPNEDDFLKSNAEALVIARSFGSGPSSATDNGVLIGGGEFGGAGSGGKY